MSRQTVKSIASSDGQRRVDIFKRDDGFFGFVELKHYERRPEEGDIWSPWSYWAPVGPPFGSIAETLEIAEREARATIAWLKV
jgi:hypothetical protein